MRIFRVTLTALSLLAFYAPGAFAGTSNPEQFSYTLSNAGYEDWHLTTADGWSANWAGTVNPPSTGSQVIVTGTGQELQMDNGYIGSNIIWWQQPVLPEASDPVQTFRYDVKHNRVYDGPNTRSLVGTQGEQGSDYTFISWFDLRPTQNQMGWTVPESPELIWEDGKLDTWYTVEVEFQYGTAFDPARAKMRYKERDAASWNDWTAAYSMPDPTGKVFRFLVNDRVTFDNISLTGTTTTVTEDFEGFTPRAVPETNTYHLTRADGWAANWAGTLDPDPSRSSVVAGQELRMDGGAANNNLLWWQQQILPDQLQTLHYDVNHVGEFKYSSRVRSMVGPQGLGEDSFPFIVEIFFNEDGTQSYGWNVTGADEKLADDLSLDTWYSIEVEFDSGEAQTARLRYKERDAESWNDWSETRTMWQLADESKTFRFVSNNVILFDNISLVGSIVEIPGDASGDGKVNLSDLSILGTYWDQSGPSIGWDQGDFNGDNTVNLSDLSILGTNWGYGETTEASAVPEPGTFALLALGLISLLILRRKQTA